MALHRRNPGNRRADAHVTRPFQRRAMECDTASGPAAVDETPDWWPYAPEFPHWHVWRGVAGLLRTPAEVEPAQGGARQGLDDSARPDYPGRGASLSHAVARCGRPVPVALTRSEPSLPGLAREPWNSYSLGLRWLEPGQATFGSPRKSARRWPSRVRFGNYGEKPKSFAPWHTNVLPMKRLLDLTALRALARGCAVLGAGGGGDPYLGLLQAMQATEDFGPVPLIDVDDLPD